MKKLPSIEKIKKKAYKRNPTWIGNPYREISWFFTRALLYTSITPNQISIISILFVLLGGGFLMIGDFWSFIWGSICFIIFSLLDRVDGNLARYKKMVSSTGKYLEAFSYHLVYLVIYTGLVFGVYRSLDNSLVLLFGLAGILFSVLIKHAVNVYHMLLLYDMLEKNKPYKKDLIRNKLVPKKLRNLSWEINALIFDNDYIPYWIIIGAILDVSLPKITIYSFTMNYLMLFIIFQFFMNFIKLIVTLRIYLRPK